MKVIAVCTGSYPYGGATTIRHMTMMKGLKELGYDVALFSIYPDKNQDPNSQSLSGIYDEIPFQYTVKNLHFASNRIKQYVELLQSSITCISQIKKLRKKEKTVIINFSTNPIIAFLVTFFLRNKSLMLHELTEFPHAKNNFGAILRFIYYRLTLPLYYKIFVISTALKQHIEKYVKADKVIIINMFVDIYRFSAKKNSPFNFEYIAYCGSMNTDKDGVPLLIEAFSIVEKNYPDIKLVLIGDIKNRPVNKKILEAVKRHKLEEKIVFTGHITSNLLPQYLQNAKILALARPDNIQAKGGFPTKLGEYLATGNPVAVTNVGDIPLFIKDGENGFLSKPDKVKFADTLIRILTNYSKAKQIGARGKSLAKEVFNYQIEVQKIHNVIQNSI